MAQQIQFIYLTQSEYDALNPKNAGRIYFTSDTHRIYKGSDLYAATTFDQLNFSSITASSITVDGSAVALEGHTHPVSDIEGLGTTLSAYASASHLHSISDVNGLQSALSACASSGHTHVELNGITSNSISKANASFASVSANTGTFDNLVVANASITATSVIASGV